MKSICYSRYTGEDLGVDAEDLLQALSDFLLESGFNTEYTSFSEANEHTIEDLKRAIERALQEGKLFDDDGMQVMMDRLQSLSPEQMDKLLDKLAQKMVDEGYINVDENADQQTGPPGAGPGRDSKIKFEVTDKSLDFLGFKTLKDLLVHAMKDMYFAENAIYKALPKMIEGAEDEGLKEGLSEHRDETKQQIYVRLSQVIREVFDIDKFSIYEVANSKNRMVAMA